MKERITAGEFGKILGARGLVTWCRGEKYYTESGWRGTKEKEGGGALINQSVHTLDLIQYLIGKKPVFMEANVSNHHLKGTLKWRTLWRPTFPLLNRPACFYATTGYVADVPPMIELECDKARVRIEDLRVTVMTADGQTQTVDYSGSEHLGKSYWGSGHRDCIRSFYESIGQDRPFSVGLKQIEDTVELMLTAYETAGRAQTC